MSESNPAEEPSALAPEEDGELAVDPPLGAAGGFPAVASTFAHAAENGPLRAAAALLRVNQTEGFDCPGCAWPEPAERTLTEFCENGAKAVADEATTRRIGPEFFRKWTSVELSRKSDLWLGAQGRLTEPMLLEAGRSRYEPVSWDRAFAVAAEELNAARSPDEAVFYASGRTSNEAAFLYQLFARLFGTNNLPDCSNLCHESSGVALKEVIGVSKGTVTLEDFDHADCIVVLGQNPGTNHPRMLTALQRAAWRGARIIAVNPLPEAGTNRFKHPQNVFEWFGAGTQLAALFLPVRINGDVALLKGILKELLIEEAKRPGSAVDREFVAEYTTGFAGFERDILDTPWELIESESGIPRAELRKAAQIILGSKRMICCWAMGLTQHRNAVANIQEVVNLLLLGGHLGRKGAGACPVRGHSNVQGDRTMGISERPDKEFLDRLGEEFGFDPPRRPGCATVEAIRKMRAGSVRVFFALGGNFLSAAPDTEYTAAALRGCRLTAHVSTKLNRSHLITGRRALILPCLGRSEVDAQAHEPQFVSVENSMGVVHASRGRLAPASGHLKSEPAIIAGLARAVFKERPELARKVDWSALIADYDRIRDAVSRVVPGFGDYNRAIREPGGFALPNPVRDERKFPTRTGKAMFTVHPITPTRLGPGRYLMMTIRSHDQYNTTIYGLDDRYRGVSGGRRVVFMNAEDMRAAGLKAQDRVDVISHFEGETRTLRRFTVIPYPIPRSCVAAYFPEANALVPIRSVAVGSLTPTSKSFVVSVELSRHAKT